MKTLTKSYVKSDKTGFLSLFTLSVFILSGCAISPKPITQVDQQKLLSDDRIKALKDVEPVGKTLTLHEAVARGIKYNLDYRSKMMEQAIALGVSDLSNYDMLPKVVANAGYNYRNNYFITNATGAYSGNPSLNEPFVSSAKNYGTAGVMLSWNILDFGVSYFNARQNADRTLVASEKRRRTMHVLVQDIQVAYLRTASAQKLKSDLQMTVKEANEALENSKKSDAQGLKSPLEALKYQKSLLDNVKILETIDQELSSAKVELNQLINLPASTSYTLEDPDKIAPPNSYAKADVQEFEVRALAHNADLKEGIYNARIAVEETRKSLVKLLPGINLNYGPQGSNNSFYINKNWVEGAAQVSFNLWTLLTASGTINLANSNEELAQQKRMMVQMAVISQVYLSKQQLENALQIYQRSAEIDKVDSKIAKITSDKEKEGAASQAEKVAANSSAIVSKLRKYQALSQLFAASGKMQATTGLEPDIGSVSDISLKEMTQIVKNSFDQWNSGKLPPVDLQPKVISGTSSASDSLALAPVVSQSQR
jgi:outer membrane protein TolC